MKMRVIWRKGPSEFPLRDPKNFLSTVNYARMDPDGIPEDKARAYCTTWNDFRRPSSVKNGFFYDYMPAIEAMKLEDVKKEKAK